MSTIDEQETMPGQRGGPPASTSDIDRDETVTATVSGGKGLEEPDAKAAHLKKEARKIQSEESRSHGGTCEYKQVDPAI